MFCFVFLDALLGARLEPRSRHSAGFGLGGRPAAGHPDVGLTFCYLSSEDFRESHTVNKPVQKQRLASSAGLKDQTADNRTVLFFMHRGVLAIAWSLADPELLLSCGKDSRILCWNPNTGEVKINDN